MTAPWLLAALRELGQHEVPGPASNPRIAEYHAMTAGGAAVDEVPWCASFSCWAMERGGHQSPRSKAARSWLLWGRPLSAAAVGCITVLSRGVDPAQGHVGFWIGGDAVTCWVLGGNQGDQVSLAPFPTARILGWRWPT